jgi:hypothetical protein
MSLHKVITDIVPQKILDKKNAKNQWEYGWNPEYDIVIISKDGTLGEIYEIQNLRIGLPKVPNKIDYKANKWQATELPKELSRIKTIFDWDRR